jgi:ubiquinone biosynthesis protein COQ4
MANPEDTGQVFVIMTALRGGSGRRLMRRFRQSPTGAAVLADRRRLLDVLENRVGLMRLAPGSLGRLYAAFMREENLSADGLVAPSMQEDVSALAPEARLLRERMRDMHDLTHVLTGYGRDPLGELCLLAFMFPQTRNLGAALIAFMGWTRFAKAGYGKPARAAILEGWRHGRKAAWLPGLDWEALMARPVDDLRQDFNIAAPTRYREFSL